MRIALILISLLFLHGASFSQDTTTTVPDPKPADSPVADPAKIVVYITATGKRYHLPNCRYAKIPSTLKDAKAQGLTPCKFCNPPE